MLKIQPTDNGTFEIFGTNTNKVFKSGFETEQQAKRYIINARARRNRKIKDDAMHSLGLVKVKGALGGTYWE